MQIGGNARVLLDLPYHSADAGTGIRTRWGNTVAESIFASLMGGLFDARSWAARGCQLFCHTWLVGRGDGDGMASGPLRLAELLVGLSGIADVGMEQGEAAS